MVVDLFLFVTCVAMTPSEFWSNDVKFAKSSRPCHSFRPSKDQRTPRPQGRSITGQKSSGGSSERLQTADGLGEAVCRWFSWTPFWTGVRGDEVTYGFSMGFLPKGWDKPGLAKLTTKWSGLQAYCLNRLVEIVKAHQIPQNQRVPCHIGCWVRWTKHYI
jgi:hypothetical protein